MKRLPVQIPLDYAEELDVSISFLSHVNAGRRKLPPPKAAFLLERSTDDPRLAGLLPIHLKPELKPICTVCKRKLRCNAKQRKLSKKA